MKLIRAKFNDIDDMCETLCDWDMEFYPLARVLHEGPVGALFQATGDCAQYGYAEFADGLSMLGEPPKELITFNIMEPTRGRYWLRGRNLDDGMAWVFPAGTELRSVSAPGFRVHTLSVSEERIERIAAAHDIDLPPSSRRPEAFPIPVEVLSKIRGYLRELRDAVKVFPFDPVSSDVLHLLVPRWLLPGSQNKGKRIPMRARDNAVRVCLELTEDCDLGQMSNEKLLDKCMVSERTLQYAFREHFGVTPHEFIKARRLAKVRSALRHIDHGSNTVGDIAARFGFWHLGRFAAEYRKAYGELPSETLWKSHRTK